MTGHIVRINGPLVIVSGLYAKLYDLVKVGRSGLIGEVIKLEGPLTYIQVYEDTVGLSVGETVQNTGNPLTVTLGPGLLSSIFDGIQRPLPELEKMSGHFIRKGIDTSPLDKDKKWHFIPTVEKGSRIETGDSIGKVEEQKDRWHYIMPRIKGSGEITEINEGDFTINEPVAYLKEKYSGKIIPVTMSQKWPVRIARPFKEKLSPGIPLITGQRVLDCMFPIAKGGTAIIPGGFGTGKTVLEQTLAKFSDSDIIVYIGCGERGNEMTDILNEFPDLTDPHTNRPLMERTILIANTSNMPVAARESSIIVGITIAEYYRDMGYNVALMADSTSRWAEALREMSSRLEEMPAEEGYPPYLGIRLSRFYERAGRVQCCGTDDRTGSITIVGAVSPPGGDFSEPVTQNSLRVAGAFWGLDSSLAYRRHFPAINWGSSYSLYSSVLDEWFQEHVSNDWSSLKRKASELLQKEEDIQKVAQVVGIEALPEQERIILESCGMIREVFLQQNAFHSIDRYCPLKRQSALLRIILKFHEFSGKYKKNKLSLEEIIEHPLKETIARLNEKTDEEFYSDINKIEKEL